MIDVENNMIDVESVEMEANSKSTQFLFTFTIFKKGNRSMRTKPSTNRPCQLCQREKTGVPGRNLQLSAESSPYSFSHEDWV